MKNQQGFTLIEAAVAVAVVAILSGIISPVVITNIRDAEMSRAKNDVQAIASAISNQLKDTATRPVAAGGLNGCTGATANAVWYSGPTLAAAPLGLGATFVAANTLSNLFTDTSVSATSLALFGFPASTLVSADMAPRGPYLTPTDAVKVDPWGSPYLVLGYNATQQTANGPIYVV